MRAPWLADVLTGAGLTVRPMGSWQGRGRDMSTIYGIVVHDTVTPPSWPDSQTARMLRDGHANLAGPLYQLGVARDGIVDLIADGRCNHNGHGFWGNDSIGIGVYANGAATPRERWNDVQEATVVAACRAILDRLGLGVSERFNPRVAGHKETDPARKVDPWKVDMGRLRAAVARQPDPDPDPILEPEPAADPDLIGDLMATGEAQLDRIADALEREATARRAQAAVAAAEHSARVRAQYGLDPDPHSDGIQGDRVAAGKTLGEVGTDLKDVAER